MANEFILEYTVASGDYRQRIMAETWHVIDGRLVFRVGQIDVAAFDYWSHFYMTDRAVADAARAVKETAEPEPVWTRGGSFIYPDHIDESGKAVFVSQSEETAEAEPTPKTPMTCSTCKHWRSGQLALEYPWGGCNIQIGYPPNNYPRTLGYKVRTHSTFSCSFYRGAAQEEAGDA